LHPHPPGHELALSIVATPDLKSPRDVAVELDVRLDYVYKLLGASIPAKKVDGKWQVSQEEIEKYRRERGRVHANLKRGFESAVRRGRL
jgi:hypothetical protein